MSALLLSRASQALALVPLLLSELRASLTLANLKQTAALAFQPLAFAFTFPLTVLVFGVRYFLLGGREANEKLAASLPALYQQRCDRLSVEASLPSTGAVSTSTRVAGKKGPLGFQSHFVANGSVNIHYVSAGDFSSTKPVLLFIHGFPQTWAAWSSQLVYFARLGFPVAAMDLRGFGLSSCPEGAQHYASRVVVSDITTVIRKLRQQNDSDVIVIGHDFGGVCTWNLSSLESNEDVKSVTKYVIINAPHPGFFLKYSIQHDRLQFLRSWYMAFFNVPIVSEWWLSAWPDKFTQNAFPLTEQPEVAAQVADRKRAKAMLSWYRGAVLDVLKHTSMKPMPTSRPVLQIWGEKDTALGVGLGTMLPPRWTPHAASRLVKLDASHWVMEEQPKAVSEAILKFVQEQ